MLRWLVGLMGAKQEEEGAEEGAEEGKGRNGMTGRKKREKKWVKKPGKGMLKMVTFA